MEKKTYGELEEELFALIDKCKKEDLDLDVINNWLGELEDNPDYDDYCSYLRSEAFSYSVENDYFPYVQEYAYDIILDLRCECGDDSYFISPSNSREMNELLMECGAERDPDEYYEEDEDGEVTRYALFAVDANSGEILVKDAEFMAEVRKKYWDKENEEIEDELALYDDEDDDGEEHICLKKIDEDSPEYYKDLWEDGYEAISVLESLGYYPEFEGFRTKFEECGRYVVWEENEE